MVEFVVLDEIAPARSAADAQRSGGLVLTATSPASPPLPCPENVRFLDTGAKVGAGAFRDMEYVNIPVYNSMAIKPTRRFDCWALEMEIMKNDLSIDEGASPINARLAFTPEIGFGRLELRAADGSCEGEIPSWLVDRPDVLKALAAIAEAGGTKFFTRAQDGQDVIVDIGSGSCTFEEPVDQ